MDDEIEEGMVVDDDENDQQRERKPEKSPHELLKESKGSVEEIVAQILSVKRQGLPKAQLRELVTQMFVHFVTLRQVNRSILLEEDRAKTETERAKAPVDFATLQLHNLMYEKSHYIKAIKTCKDFKSKNPDIELVPEEEFFRDAPEEIKGSVTANEAHDLMLRRLNFELFQRKELCKLHEQLEQRKRVLQEAIANRKKFLSSLPSHLKSLRKASLPVQNQLGIQHTKKMKLHNMAELLPPPLYVVYSQLMAQREAFEESIDLEIVGSLKEAQAFVRQQASKDSGTSSNLESSKLEDDAPDGEDDGQRRRKRSRKFPAKENLEHAVYYQIHPLKVFLHIFDDEASDPKPAKLITLKFEHMPKLNVVTVGVEGSNVGPQDNILCNLFPDDTGRDLPHQSAKLAIGDSLSFDERRTSRPYKWVQHLAGIDFLPELSPLLKNHETLSRDITKTEVVSSGLTLYRQQNRVETILQRVRSRKKAQLALMEQLHSLQKLQWPTLDCKNVPWAHHQLSCKLHSWSSLGSAPDHPSPAPPVDNEQVKEPMDTAPDGLSGKRKDETESAREDGELPSLVAASAVSDTKLTPRGSSLARTRQLALMAKSISSVTKAKSLSFKKQDDELDMLLDLESDLDEPSPTEQEMEDAATFQMQRYKALEKAWFNYGVREFCLVLTSKVDGGDRILKLEAKIKISMEYPLRPPSFSLSLDYPSRRGNCDNGDGFQWSDKLRAMEAEVNLNMFNILPLEQESQTLAHQVYFLAMMFDDMVDEISPSSGKSEATSIIDVGLCKPVSGKLLARSVRGRDRRKIIPWRH